MNILNLISISISRPSRLLLGQLNPWKFITNKIIGSSRDNNVDIDVILHLGDQVYPDDENISHAAKIFAKLYDDMDESKQNDMMDRGRELYREKYRKDFNMPFKKEVLAKVSNLMIWSDNDVANDFTTLKLYSSGMIFFSRFE